MSDYLKYVENPENGLRQEKKIDKLAYVLQYKPVEYMVAIEQKHPELKTEVLKKRSKEMSDLQCYTLRLISADKHTDVATLGLNSDQDYTVRNTYMSFDMQNDIYMVDGSDTLSCALFQYTNNYGLAPYADFVIAFENKYQDKIQDKIVVYDDKIFGGGIIKFSISKEDIQKTPPLKTY